MGKLVAKNNFITLLDRHGKAIKPRAVQEIYTGADTGRLMNDLPYSDYTAKSTIQGNAERLRARARHLERNNDIVRRALYLVEQNVVGPNGIKLVSLARKSRSDDRVAQETITREWVRFIKSADIRLRYQSFRQAMKMVCRRRVVDGEAFVELMPGFGNQTRFSFRMIDPSHVPVGYNDDKRRISMGVEYDENWTPVAYYVSDRNGEHRATVGMFGEGRYRRVTADRMIHFFTPERPNQGRGVSMLSSPIQRLHMLDQYEEATLVGARIASSKMGFFYDEVDDENAQPYSGADTDESPAQVDPETGRAYEEENFIDIEAGQFEDIGTKKFTAFDPGYPPAGYDEYTSSILRSISAGLNIPYYQLSHDLRDVNYSTAREARLDAVDSWRDQQGQLRDAVLDPIFDSWMKVQLLRPDFSAYTDADIPRLSAHRWQFRGWSWIDPQKEANANLLQVQMGIKAPSEIVAEQGRDYEQVIDQTAKDLELARSKGVDIETILYGSEWEETVTQNDDE